MQNEDEKPTSNAAIGSVALAIAGLFIFGIYAGLVAVGLGFYAKDQVEKGHGKGLKTAMAGIWGGTAVAALSLVAILSAPPPPPAAAPAPLADTWPGLVQHYVDKIWK